MINVPQAGMFFVDGAVRKPGSYAIARSYTLTQALATAGGVNEELAKTSGIAILRRRDGFEADRTVINLGQVLAGSVPDPHIDADDVIFVPTSTGKYLVRRFLGGIGLGTLPIP
jgi:polysaccharide export outer membrane protein